MEDPLSNSSAYPDPFSALLTLYNTFKPRAASIPIPSTKGAYPPTITGAEAELVVVSVEFPSEVPPLLPFDFVARE